MKNLLLPVLFVVLTGCAAHAHTSPAAATIYVAPPPPPTARVIVHTPVIRYHFVYTNHRWVRRTGPPPAGARYHAHPRHRNAVIVHRSTTTRNPHHRHHHRGKTVRRSTR